MADELTARLRAAMTPLAENDAVSPEVFAEVCDAHLAVATFFAARLSAAEQALREIARREYIGETTDGLRIDSPVHGREEANAIARAALAGREETGGG